MLRLNRFLDNNYESIDCERIKHNLNCIIGEVGARLLLAAEVLLYGEVR